MNKLNGIIVGLICEDDISLVEIDVQGNRMFSLVLEVPDQFDFLAVGKQVSLFFKESEVFLAAGSIPAVSVPNRLPCYVKTLRNGSVISHLELEFKGLTLHALVTTQAVKDLDLAPGREVEAMIQASEIALGWEAS